MKRSSDLFHVHIYCGTVVPHMIALSQSNWELYNCVLRY